MEVWEILLTIITLLTAHSGMIARKRRSRLTLAHVVKQQTQIAIANVITSGGMTMTNQEFIALVAEMRILQSRYYKSNKNIDILRQSKAAELAVDKAVQELTATTKQTSLF
jgi:hypothetical protein